MSKYNRQKSTYNDRDCLVAALNEQGYTEVEVHEEAVNLIGYHGDTRPEKANVIVRRKHIGTAANDLGFVKEADGTFSTIVSDYDSHKHGVEWMTGTQEGVHREAHDQARGKERAEVSRQGSSQR